MARTKISSSRQFTVDANLDVASFKIVNVATGTASTDAVNVAQLEAAFQGTSSGLFAPVQTIALMKAITISEAVDKYMINVEDVGLFRYDYNADDVLYPYRANEVELPNVGVGRWIKMSNKLQDHNSASGKQGGTTDQYYHLTSAQHTLATQNASSTQGGLMTATDWNTFNNKQTALGFTPENVANKGVANGYASLNASSLVVQNPANATATPTASKIPIADANGKLDGWISGNIAGKTFITRETPTGTKNGSNTSFTLANTPISGTEMIFLNGILQEPGAGNDYTISTFTITMLTAPISTDKLVVTYWK